MCKCKKVGDHGSSYKTFFATTAPNLFINAKGVTFSKKIPTTLQIKHII